MTAEAPSFRDLLYRRMLAQANLVAALSDHPTLVGSSRERALAELLRELIPRRYEVLSGTVLLESGRRHVRSPQIDLMIVDTFDYPAVLRAGDIAVVPPEAIRAVIEVKSDLENVKREDGMVKEGETFLRAVEQVGRIVILRLAEQGEDVRGASILALVDAILQHLHLNMLVGAELQGSGSLKRAFQRLSLTVGPQLAPAPGCEDLAIQDPRAPGEFVVIDLEGPDGA